MTLIRRYNHSSEYASMLSTAPMVKPQNYATLFPTLGELQTVFIRMRSDPDLPQGSIFVFTAPLFTFVSLLVGCLLILSSSAVGVVLNVLEDFEQHKIELGLGVAGLAFSVLVLLGLWRVVLWAIAGGVRAFVEADLASVKSTSERSPDDFELSEANVLIGGFI